MDIRERDVVEISKFLNLRKLDDIALRKLFPCRRFNAKVAEPINNSRNSPGCPRR